MQVVSSRLVALVIILSSGPSLALAEVKADIDKLDFEQQSILFDLIGTPDDNPVNSEMSITSEPDEVMNGEYALKFSYQLDPDASPALLDVKTLLRDMTSISFWIKSETEANWVVYVRDRDGAGFLTLTDVEPGVWTFISLSPEDFQPALEGDVVKDEIEPERLDIGLVLLDARNKYETPGELNTVYIDDLTIGRGPLELITGDYVVDGTSELIDQPTSIEGDIIVENGGRLDVTATRLELKGNIVARNGGTIDMVGGSWTLRSDFSKQFSLDVSDSSDLIFRDGEFWLSTAIGGEVRTDSRLRFDTVRNGTAGMTVSIRETGTLEMLSSLYIGEFILDEDTATTITDTSLVIIWVNCKSVFSEPIIVPDGETVTSWSAPESWGRVIDVTDSTNLVWTFNLLPGCDLQLQDSDIRAVGLVYWTEAITEVSVSGLEPDVVYDELCVDGPQMSLCLINSSVQSWNLYSTGGIIVNVTDSTLGEAISFEDSLLSFSNTVVDGTGGILGSRDQSIVQFNDGTITTTIQSDGASEMQVNNSSIVGTIVSADDAVVTLSGTTHDGLTKLFGNGIVNIE